MPKNSGKTYTVGQYLVDRLYEVGVKHLFAIPGDYCAEWVHKYLEPSEIERIGSTNEMNAGYSADGYARQNGIGAACVTYSVGAFSLLNPIVGAYVEEVPVIVINGAPSTKKMLEYKHAGFTYHHIVNGSDTDLRVYENVTVAAVRLDNAALAPDQIDNAIRECLTKSKPVYIETPEDIYDQPCERPIGKLTAAPQISDVTSLKLALESVIEKLKAANNPLIWAGIELERFHLQDDFKALIDKFNIPYVSSLLGKGVISEDNEHFKGVFDGNGTSDKVKELFNKSDFILGLGVWITDENTLGYPMPYEKMSLASRRFVKTGLDVQCDVILKDLLENLLKSDIQNVGSASEITSSKYEMEPAPKHEPGNKLTYQSAYDQISKNISTSLKEQPYVIMGGTGFNFFGSLSIPILTQSGYVTQAAYADIGYVTPAAVGVALAEPNKRVLVFAGDGGFQMTAQCISTMVRLNLNPIIFVMNNGIYGIEQWLADPAVFNNKEKVYPLCVLHDWNYSKLMDVWGGKGWKVETHGDLDRAFNEAMKNTDGPSLIQVCVPEKSIPTLAEYKVKGAS